MSDYSTELDPIPPHPASWPPVQLGSLVPDFYAPGDTFVEVVRYISEVEEFPTDPQSIAACVVEYRGRVRKVLPEGWVLTSRDMLHAPDGTSPEVYDAVMADVRAVFS